MVNSRSMIGVTEKGRTMEGLGGKVGEIALRKEIMGLGSTVEVKGNVRRVEVPTDNKGGV